MSKPLQVGSLLFAYQAIDIIGPLDLLNMCSRNIMTHLLTYVEIPTSTLNAAPDFNFHHIGETLEPVSLLTSNLTITPTTTCDTCPDLDILLIGGPNPEYFQLQPRFAEFIRDQVRKGVTVMSTCTGSFVLASAGVLEGREATINNQEFHWVKERFPGVKWRKDVKWVVDKDAKTGQEMWTGSGAVAGMDMVGHWVKERYGLEVLDQGSAGLDYEPRDVRGRLDVLPVRVDGEGRERRGHVYP